MVYTGEWHLPAVVPYPIPRCNDYTANHAYVGECTNTVPPLNRPIPPHAPHPPAYYSQTPCVDNLPEHAPGFTVCANCVGATEGEHWFKLAKAKMANDPPDNKPGGRRETKRWRGFWTRMCRLCERREQYLIKAREGQPGHIPVAHPPQAVQDQMKDYPRNTCTCEWHFKQPRRCRQHFRLHWLALKPTLEHQRNMNMEWLRTSSLHPAGQHLWTANQTRLNNRYYIRNRCMLRACRCGREVTQRDPEVYQCMACEGIIETTPMALAYMHTFPPTPAQQLNSASPGAPFALGRYRSARTR